MKQVEFKQISKSFGKDEVIKDVSFEIEKGEFVVFVGPSGSGKSTLLRIIAGLEETSEGELLIDNQPMTKVDPSDRRVAMVFQSYALYPHMSVSENIEFPLRMHKVRRDVRREKVLEAARFLQLDQLLERKPKMLSGGQRQRVAIGRAIVRDPQVFLFDEPLSNLDAELRNQMRFEISNLHRKLKSTIVYVTHDQVEAMTLADKIVVLNRGRVEGIGSPLELYGDPKNLFVAGFIGSPKMNFLRLKMHQGSRNKYVNVGKKKIAFHKDYSPDEIILGVRPEHLIINGKLPIKMNLKIHSVEHLGSTTHINCELNQVKFLIDQKGIHKYPANKNLSVGVEEKHVYFFSPTDETRVLPINFAKSK